MNKIPYIAIICLLIIVGVLIYEKISNDNTINQLDDLNAILTADTARLTAALRSAMGELEGIKDMLSETEQGNQEIGNLLESGTTEIDKIAIRYKEIEELIIRCKDIARETGSEGFKSGRQIDESLQLVKKIREGLEGK